MVEGHPAAPTLRGVATVCGERELSAADLAALQGVSAAAAERSLGDTRLFVRDGGSDLAFGLVAASRCLERAGVAGDALDGIVWVGNPDINVSIPTQYLQEQLGARDAWLNVSMDVDCSRAVSAVTLARALLLDAPTARRILVVGGLTHAWLLPGRTVRPLAEDRHELVMSDAAFAVLVDREGPGPLLIGSGAASYGGLWEHARILRVGTAEERAGLLSEAQVLHECKDAHRAAMRRALDAAGIGVAQIDHVLFSREVLVTLEQTLLRQLRLDPARLFRRPGWASHTGLADQWIALEALLAKEARPGQHVLVVARTYGVMCCAVLRL